MAALSSSQSGAFNSSSTWNGNTPADGDTFTINRGHKVTVNADLRPTNGYGDIALYGKLEIGNQGQFRLNGRITIYGNGSAGYFSDGDSNTSGFLHMTAGSSMEIRGTNDDRHGIWMETQKHCQMILQGTQKNLNTNLSSAIAVDHTYLPVNSATNWAVGDWVTVFNRSEDYRVNGDEGFWVHDVDTTNNKIYFRQFVSPSTTVTAVNSTTVTVANAKVFRKNYLLICGTGSNRNIGRVTSINYSRNQLTMDNSFSSSAIGETLYQTGAEKAHLDDCVVRRMATTIKTAISANNTNQITIGNASDISVGDVIVIDVNNDNDTNWDYDARHTVSSKSGNTLTLDRNVGYNIKVGSIVTIITRDVKIHAVDDNSSTRPFILTERWTSGDGRSRVVIFQDVWLKGLGRNTGSAYYSGVMTAGYTSYCQEDNSSDGYNTQSRYDCVVYEQPNNRSSYTGLNVRDSRQFVYRNCMSYRCERGIWGYSGNYNWRVFNHYTTRTWYASFQTDGFYEPWGTVQYFYATRSDDYGFMYHHMREQMNIRHVILLNHEQRPMYVFYVNNECVLERFLVDGYRSFPYVGDRAGRLVLLDSDLTNRWDWSAPDGTGQVYSNYGNANASDLSTYYRNTGTTQFMDIVERNFEYDGHAIWHGGLLAIWNSAEKAWECRNYNDPNAGVFESVYVAPDTTVRISCEVKCQSGFSGTRPHLWAAGHRNQYNRGRWRTQVSGQTSTQNSTDAEDNGIDGFEEMIQYGSASNGSYENKQITIQPKTKGYFLIYGVTSTSTNIREEPYYMKDPIINISQTPAISKSRSMNKKMGIRNSFVATKKRIGGTRL